MAIEQRTLRGHTSSVRSVVFSPDGKRLASAGGDKTVKLWDARPLTAEVLAEREALGLVEFLFSQPLAKKDVTESIQDNKTIGDEVRRHALALAEQFREEQDPKRFNAASRALVRRQHLAPRWYRQALVQAQAACRSAPKVPSHLNTLGIAQYRLGRDQEAVDTLTQFDQLDAAKPKSSIPSTLAFLAMAHQRLGQKEKAQDYSNHLRETMKESQWAKDDEAQAFLREAEALISKPAEDSKK